MSDSILQNKYTTCALAAIAAALVVYIYVHNTNQHKSSTNSVDAGLKTQAVRWRSTNYQMKPQSQFVMKNSQNAVTNFSRTNPFVGKIKNGIMIDGSST